MRRKRVPPVALQSLRPLQLVGHLHAGLRGAVSWLRQNNRVPAQVRARSITLFVLEVVLLKVTF